MTRFSASNRSEAVVAAAREEIWAVLTDPGLLTQLTPLLQHVEADGDLWRWDLARIPVLGVAVAPSFTERMTFEPPSRIAFTHAPPTDASERGGVDGWYTLVDVDGGTLLSTALSVEVDLPLPRASSIAVRGVMRTVMARMGDRFGANLERHLGLR